MIENTNWDLVITGNVNEALANWENTYMQIMKECIPQKKNSQETKSTMANKGHSQGWQKAHPSVQKGQEDWQSYTFETIQVCKEYVCKHVTECQTCTLQ